ncbi:16S rRNA (uracil(1498)-N(3))-methyltransferase [Seongchinamella sediminis]|uniref:Ribosomal RNA small subunit methyltransferase E n=1 Tax=Seongchinamella sediminis TaxID=2283635 RepID=A0A3L7E2M8_9GAMM|nr:16S rRNA (uracil(1498)-N(3))-methyltransferase [Seongchinamella sediminis]RLQ23804.1 16S rRNA (uracil(1498)-N(3))-methyltransferase [Seongchinamella sediminis]
MNLLLFSDRDRGDSGLLRIAGPRLQHLLQVHGKAAGESLRVGEINGMTGSATIVSIDRQAAVLDPVLTTPPPDKLPLTLVVALPRPKMLRRILRTVAELGVAELHLVNTYRVEKSFWQTPVLAAATIRHYLLEGLEQSRDTVLPPVHCHRRFKPFVEDMLPGLAEGRKALLAHPGDHPPCPRGISGPALLAIGPEGGFIPYEVEKLQAAGCEPVSLGPRILRVETAVTALLGRLF